jgi:hypothetical protein
LRIRGLKAQLADSEARCLKAGNRIEELVTALTVAKAMADAVEQALKPWDRSPPHTPAWVLELRAALDAWDKVGK